MARVRLDRPHGYRTLVPPCRRRKDEVRQASPSTERSAGARGPQDPSSANAAYHPPGACEAVTATAIQMVGVKGYDGFVIGVVNGARG